MNREGSTKDKPNMNGISSDIIFLEPIQQDNVGYSVLNNFSVHSKRSKFVHSQLFYSSGSLWKLNVYPRGIETSNAYISVFLELISESPNYSKYQCSIDLCNRIKSKDYSRLFTANFKKGDCWGFRSYYPRYTLDQNGFVENDSLCFRFQIKSLSKASFRDKFIDGMNSNTVGRKASQSNHTREIELDFKSNPFPNDFNQTLRNSWSTWNSRVDSNAESIDKIINSIDTISVPELDVENINWEIKDLSKIAINGINNIGAEIKVHGLNVLKDDQIQRIKDSQMTLDEIDLNHPFLKSDLNPEIKNDAPAHPYNLSCEMKYNSKCQKNDQSLSASGSEVHIFKEQNYKLKDLMEIQNDSLMNSIDEKLRNVEDTFCSSLSEIGSQTTEYENIFRFSETNFDGARFHERRTAKAFHANFDPISSLNFNNLSRKSDSYSNFVSVLNDKLGFDEILDGIDQVNWIGQDETTFWIEQ